MQRPVSLNEAAKLTDLTYFQIGSAVREGRLKSEVIGGRHFVRLADVRKLRPRPIGRLPGFKVKRRHDA